MDNWNNNQEQDMSSGGQFSSNPYQDQSTTNTYEQPQSSTDIYGQSQNTGNSYSQPQNTMNSYNQSQNTTGAYNQQQNTAGGYGYGQGQNNYAYGQPFANYNQSPYQGGGLTPTEMEEPVGIGEWTGLLALATFVPCIGIILVLVWAFGNTEKKSKSNFCKAFLIIWLIKLAVSAILFIVWGASLAAMISEF